MQVHTFSMGRTRRIQSSVCVIHESLKLNIPLSSSAITCRVSCVVCALFSFRDSISFFLWDFSPWFIHWLPGTHSVLSSKFEACCAHDRLAATIQNNQRRESFLNFTPPFKHGMYNRLPSSPSILGMAILFVTNLIFLVDNSCILVLVLVLIPLPISASASLNFETYSWLFCHRNGLSLPILLACFTSGLFGPRRLSLEIFRDNP